MGKTLTLDKQGKFKEKHKYIGQFCYSLVKLRKKERKKAAWAFSLSWSSIEEAHTRFQLLISSTFHDSIDVFSLILLNSIVIQGLLISCEGKKMATRRGSCREGRERY